MVGRRRPAHWKPPRTSAADAKPQVRRLRDRRVSPYYVGFASFGSAAPDEGPAGRPRDRTMTAPTPTSSPRSSPDSATSTATSPPDSPATFERDRRGGSVVADGYPAATLGGGTSGSGGDVTLHVRGERRRSPSERRGTRHPPVAHPRRPTGAPGRRRNTFDECYAHVAALDLLDKADDPTAASCTHHATHGHDEPHRPIPRSRGARAVQLVRRLRRPQRRRTPTRRPHRTQGPRPPRHRTAGSLGDGPLVRRHPHRRTTRREAPPMRVLDASEVPMCTLCVSRRGPRSTSLRVQGPA